MHSWKHLGRMFAALALVVAIAGCSGKDDTVAPGTDEQELSALVTSGDEFADYFDLETCFGDDSAALAPGLPIALAPIEDLVGWHRVRESVTHTVTSQVEGDIAHVTHEAVLTGTLRLRALVEGEPAAFQKPMVNESERHATFQRRSAPMMGESRWRLVSVSGTLVESAVDGNPPTVGIASITLEAAGQDPIVITDPSVEIARDEIPTFAPGTEVTVTVTPSGGAAVAFLHSGGRHGAPRFREPLALQEDGTYRGTWHAPFHPGVFHAAMDLLSEPTLFESEAADGPYDSVIWELPFRVSAP